MSKPTAAKATKTTARTSDFFAACKMLFNAPTYAIVLHAANAKDGTLEQKEANAKLVLRGLKQTDDPIAALKAIGRWPAKA